MNDLGSVDGVAAQGDRLRALSTVSSRPSLPFAAAGIPILIVLLLSDHVKWHWVLGAVAAVLAGLVSFGTSRAERKHEEDLAAAEQAAKDAKASAEPINQALLAQLNLRRSSAQRPQTSWRG